MTESRVDSTVRLVLGVARLGEADLKGWWNCHGLSEVGQFVLDRAFPRTARSAGLELDLLSARRRHDDALSGRPTALHLFSDELPFRRWASAWLSEQKMASPLDPLFDELAVWDVATAVGTLREQAGEPEEGEAIADGLRLGRIRRADLDDESELSSVARRLASAYTEIDGTFLAPYFDLAG